jgi:hypothetical protein
MDTIYIPNKAQTKLFSQPSHEPVRVAWIGDHYRAIEGSHRALAAEKFGYELNIDVLEEDEIVNDHDIQGVSDTMTVQEIIDYLYDSEIIAVSVDVAE